MAPFRSSRTTRNFDATQNSRARGGPIDHDPMEGLPVQRWRLGKVMIKQDPPSEAADDTNQTETNKNAFPWPEQPLPSFFSQLPSHSQEILRRARAGSRRTEVSKYDAKTETYRLPNSEATALAAKSPLLVLQPKPSNKVGVVNADSPAAANEDLIMVDENDHENENEIEGENDNEDDADDENIVAADDDLPASKPRQRSQKQERAFQVMRWIPMSSEESEKFPDPEYLAARRPGMPSLYGNHGILGVGGVLAAGAVANATSAGTAGFTNAVDENGVPIIGAGGEAVVVPTGPGRSMPPKRKKKKLGGPGRKKAKVEEDIHRHANETGGIAGEAGNVSATAGTGTGTGTAAQQTNRDGDGEGDGEGDGDEEGSGSESEGSDDDTVHAPEPEPSTTTSAPAQAPALATTDTPVTAPAPIEIEPAPEMGVAKLPTEAQQEITTLPASAAAPDVAPAPTSAPASPPSEPAPAPAPVIVVEEHAAAAVDLASAEEPKPEAVEDVEVDLLGNLETAVEGEMEAKNESEHKSDETTQEQN